ncbi:MAG: HEAT repeat domain-containing protein [Sedimentisphaerales bacterium]|nr:HEAT repeat domain-containing protein [Sedimentisphaerales bacterium]
MTSLPEKPLRCVCLWLCILTFWCDLGIARERPAPLRDGVPRQYAPPRLVDITHVKIDVTPDFAARTVTGVTTITFTPIARPLTELKLDAIDLNVASVESTASVAGYTTDDEAITITFAAPLLPGEEDSVTVRYDAEPRQGLYFRTPQMGYPETDVHLFTQGESHEAPHWYPNYDYPNERFSSEVICRVPPDMTVVSNGRLVSEQIDARTGLKAVHWLQAKPHVNYLVAMVAGYFDKIESQYRDIPLAFYTPPSQSAQAANSFDGTAHMIAFFEEEIGVPYPWDKYDQAVVEDFVAGGMENTSLTILADRTLFTDATENIRSSQSLVAHELAHQWFGDYVTCKDWSHIWLNEGFATYYEDLYDGHKNGRDSMLYGLYRTASGMVSRGANEEPIVTRRYENADDQFDYRTYGKAGWVLHMLRCQLGERLYRNAVRTYLQRHALGVAVTEDLRSIIEELSGRSFDRFFDQWLFHGGYPQLKVSYTWSEADKLAKITVEQTQAGEDGTTIFYLPTKVRFSWGETSLDREILIDSDRHDFYFALHGEPNVVRFDPDLTVLADVTFDKPREMLYAQLADTSDVVGRLLAVDALREKKDKKTVAHLKDTLNRDPFYGVRREASSALQEIHTDEAFAALADSLAQDDARVRVQVVRDIGRFYRPEVPALMEQVLASEKNPEIVAAAIDSLGRYHGPQTQEYVRTYLQSTSYRNELASAAIGAIRALDDASFVDELMVALRAGKDRFPSRSFATGLETLAYIARDEEDRTTVREFLASYVNDPKRAIQSGAIGALGTLGDPKAIPIVETFASREARDPLQRTAQRALTELRQRQDVVPEEIVALRETVAELKKETDKLKQDLEDLKKQTDAKAQAEPAPAADTADVASQD